MSRRGLAYWPGDGKVGARFYTGASDGRMIAVDVKTGQLAKEFGVDGAVDLKASVSVDGGVGSFGLPSPPAVYRHVIITGGTNGEGEPATGRLYGDIRGWDARTGKMLWTFHTVPRPGEPGSETWPAGAYKNRSGTNAWGFMTVDVERGIVYAPIGSPTADFYGADRHGNNLYGNSLVALDALTGKLKWYQQLVHHDLWDYDPAAPPTLINARRGGRVIPAVAQITKMGLLFIFDRVSGEPVFGMEEMPVPQTDVPGEWTAKTQPFPVKPAPLSRMTFDPTKDFYTLTPEHATWCKNLWEQNQLFAAGPYAPMPLGRDVVTFPSTLGGGGFGGVSYNPQLGLVFVNVSNLGMVGRMEPRTDPKTGKVTYVKNSVTGGPYGRFWNPDNRIPCSAPPFGELVAVNVNTRRCRLARAARDRRGAGSERHQEHRRPHAWREHGDGERSRVHRRHGRQALPCVRREDRQGALGHRDRRGCQGSSHDISRARRTAVRRHHGWRRTSVESNDTGVGIEPDRLRPATIGGQLVGSRQVMARDGSRSRRM